MEQLRELYEVVKKYSDVCDGKCSECYLNIEMIDTGDVLYDLCGLIETVSHKLGKMFV